MVSLRDRLDSCRGGQRSGDAVLNDTTVWCQTRGVTEPQRELRALPQRIRYGAIIHLRVVATPDPRVTFGGKSHQNQWGTWYVLEAQCPQHPLSS